MDPHLYIYIHKQGTGTCRMGSSADQGLVLSIFVPYIYIYINTYIHIHLQAAAEASMGRIVMRLSPSGHGHLEIGASHGHMKAGYLTLLTHANMFHARLTLTGYQGA